MITKRNTATLKSLETKGIKTGSDNASAVKKVSWSFWR